MSLLGPFDDVSWPPVNWEPFPPAINLSYHYLSHVWRTYSLEYKDLVELWNIQYGLCPLCFQKLHLSGRMPDIHHNHDTGEVYGYFHPRCNRLLYPFECDRFDPLQPRKYCLATARGNLLDSAEIMNYTTPRTPYRKTPCYDFTYILEDVQEKHPRFNCAQEYAKGKKAFDEGTPAQQGGIKYHHNLDPSEYFELFARQYFSCAICLDRVKPFDYFAHVDHCSVTNTNCGILCMDCNMRAMPIYEHGLAPDGAEIMGIQFD